MRALFVLVAFLVSVTGLAHAGPPPSVSALAFSSDGTLFVGYTDGAVERWRVGPSADKVFRRPTRDGAITSIATSADGQFVATVAASGVRLWDAEMTDTAGFLPRACAPVAFGPTGSVLTARTGKRGLSLWGMRAGKMAVVTTLLPDQTLYDLSVDGLTAATAKGGWEVRLWSLASGRPKLSSTIKSHGWGGISGVRLSPDGHLVLALGSTTARPPDAFARVFDARTGKEAGYYAVGTNVYSACVSANGRLIAVCGSLEGDGALLVGDLGTGKVLWAFNIFAPGADKVGDVSKMALSSDGRWLATAGSEGLRVWDARTGKVASTLR